MILKGSKGRLSITICHKKQFLSSFLILRQLPYLFYSTIQIKALFTNSELKEYKSEQILTLILIDLKSEQTILIYLGRDTFKADNIQSEFHKKIVEP